MPSDEDIRPRTKSKTSKKKESKAQSRSETNLSFDSESDMTSKAKRKKKMAQLGGDIVEEKVLEYDGGANEQTYNHNSETRKKRNRKQKRSPHTLVNGNDDIYTRNDYDEEQIAPHSRSNMGGSTVSSNKYNGRVRNNGQPSLRAENHFNKGYVEYDHGDYMSEMGNNDPIDEYGQDYDMSEEEDEEEPRFKYSTADLSDGGFRSQKCCLLSAGAFFILIAIAVSILMMKLLNKDDER